MLYEPTLRRKVFYIVPTNFDIIQEQLKLLELRYIIVQPTPIYQDLLSQITNSIKFSQIGQSYLYEYKQ